MKKLYRCGLLAVVCILCITTLFPVYAVSTSSDEDTVYLTSENSTVNVDTVTAVAASYWRYESEPNNSSSTANRTEDDYNNGGYISSASDVDWWVVKFSQSGYANFWLGNIPSGCDYDLRLYDSDGSTMLSSSTRSGNSDELIGEYWVLANKNYYIRINSYTGSSSSSEYLFRTKNYPYHAYAGYMYSSLCRGITATISAPSSYPYVSDSGESAWVSTTPTTTSTDWIQCGLRYYMGFPAFKSYTESYTNHAYVGLNHTTHSLGTSVTYKVEYNSSDGRWHAYIGSNDRAQSDASFNPSNKVQACGEVHKKGIEMGPFTFSYVKIKTSSGSWITSSGTAKIDTPFMLSGNSTGFTASGF